jgi:hypothetical protein
MSGATSAGITASFQKWMLWILLAVALIAIGICVWLYLHPRTATLTQTKYQTLTVERPVEKLVKVPVIVKVPIMVYSKQTLADAVPPGTLPLELAPSPATSTTAGTGLTDPPAAPPSHTEVIANAQVPASEDGSSIFTLLDTSTGEATIIARELPAPWFALENHGQLAGWYGYNQHLAPNIQADAQWSFLRVKDVHLGLRLQGNTGSGLYAGAGVIYKW